MASRCAIRNPRVVNKYNLKPKDIETAIVLDYDKLHKPPFWRNDVIQAWCLSDGAGRGLYGGWVNAYWIGIFDKNAKSHAGEVHLSCTSYEGMCGYDFENFFDYDEIDNEIDLEMQEKLLERINWLINEGIIKIFEGE